jgi:transcriptional regulator with XRE-family HTH domain
MTQPIVELMDEDDLARALGQNIKLARVARGFRREDLCSQAGVSLQALKNLEGGGNVELKTYLRAACALGLARGLLEQSEPRARTLDELERMELARMRPTRVRITRNAP